MKFMRKGLLPFLLFSLSLLVNVQLFAQANPRSITVGSTTTYSALTLASSFNGGNASFAYTPSGVLHIFSVTPSQDNGPATSSDLGGAPVPTPDVLPAGYTYNSDGTINDGHGNSLSSLDVNNSTGAVSGIISGGGSIIESAGNGGASVPFDGGLSLMLAASGIGYASKRLKAKK